jgi:hypothetical protein
MALLQSTNESPLLFLHSYLLNDGVTILRQRFTSHDTPDYFYSLERDVIVVQGILPRNDQRGELLDEKMNLREYTITFKEYVADEFKQQLKESKRFIREQSNKNTVDQNENLYKSLLVTCLNTQKRVDVTIDIRFSTEIDKYISGILTYIWKKFNAHFPAIPEIKIVRKYFKSRGKSNITGFKLKVQQRNGSVDDFYEYLKDRRFISSRTKKKYLKQFLNGQIPDKKINWIKAPHELVYFITQLREHPILHTPPKQPWKYLDLIFNNDGENLPQDWHRNHNKLKSQVKKNQITHAIHIIKPRFEQ